MILKLWFKFFLQIITPISLISTISFACDRKPNFQSSFAELKEIKEIIDKTLIEKQQPQIKIPNKNKQINHYTAEALDCARWIVGNEFIDPKTNLTLVSNVQRIEQNVGWNYADIYVGWRFKKSIYQDAVYPKKYRIEGFKKIPVFHLHYIRTNQVINSEECLVKYNGDTRSSDLINLNIETYTNESFEINKENIEKIVKEIKTEIENPSFLNLSFLNLETNHLILELKKNNANNYGKAKIIILNEIGKQIKEKNSVATILSNRIKEIETFLHQDLNFDIIPFENVIYALFAKLYSNQNLEQNNFQLTKNLFQKWILNQLIQITNYLKLKNNKFLDKLEKIIKTIN
ncbi:hypothetical protein [Mycoplasmopsis cricetuli]|uniref:hypothetical protein n=1 Tax=Mycoplasmopsis cricetuli TaxID=171283 RepID=UPI000470C9D7|nr:hypothetical protein [Mycoplasmopsis cricetuli]